MKRWLPNLALALLALPAEAQQHPTAPPQQQHDKQSPCPLPTLSNVPFGAPPQEETLIHILDELRWVNTNLCVLTLQLDNLVLISRDRR